MVVDTSVLAAIAFAEPDAQELLALLHGLSDVKVSAASLVELHIVLLRRIGDLRAQEAEFVFAGLAFQVVPVDEMQALAARLAFTKFGKGRHPAALNFGDCFSYALAKTLDEPLLFKGDDFGKTDVRVLQRP